MEDIEFKQTKEKIEAFKKELKDLMVKNDFGKEESYKYNGMEECYGVDYHFTVNGVTWLCETITEILCAAIGYF